MTLSKIVLHNTVVASQIIICCLRNCQKVCQTVKIVNHHKSYLTHFLFICFTVDNQLRFVVAAIVVLSSASLNMSKLKRIIWNMKQKQNNSNNNVCFRFYTIVRCRLSIASTSLCFVLQHQLPQHGRILYANSGEKRKNFNGIYGKHLRKGKT